MIPAISLGITLALGGMADASASTLYAVDRVFVGGARIAGTIETDGTLGPLAPANFVDWNLVISDVNLGFTLTLYTGPTIMFSPIRLNSAISVGGAGLTATATGLFFDFSSASDGHLSVTSTSLLTCPGGSQVRPDWHLRVETILLEGEVVGVSRLETLARFQCPIPGQIALPFHAAAEFSTLVQIGTAVPEPATLPLLWIGLAGVGLTRRARGARDPGGRS